MKAWNTWRFSCATPRTYDPALHELDNPLTDEGLALARRFGDLLPQGLTLRAYASPVERCQQTARMIIEGPNPRAAMSPGARTVEALGSFYVLDSRKLGRAVQSIGDLNAFYRCWFDGEIPADVVMPSRLTAQILAQVSAEKLNYPVQTPQVDVLVSHDMNLYPLREHLLGQSIEADGPVMYLDALAFYRKKHGLMMRSQHGAEKVLTLPD